MCWSTKPPSVRSVLSVQCDICRENLTGKQAYCCSDCSINVCITCFVTKGTNSDGAETENVVRSDKGRGKTVQLTTYTYFKRVLGFAKTEQHCQFELSVLYHCTQHGCLLRCILWLKSIVSPPARQTWCWQ